MPFAPFRDRLGSGSKHDHSTISRSSTQSSEGNTLDKTASSSSHVDTSPSNSAALQALIAQPLSADPVQFVQDALTPLFTYNSKHHTLSLSDVLEHHVPRYFAPHYRHSFNLTEADLLGWIERTRMVRQNCKRTRVRFSKALIDTAERQSMQHALVSLMYEIIVTIPYREDDIRMQAHGVYKIEHGKLTQAMVVVELHEAMQRAPEIPACVIT